jgi:ribulose-5-phosphate 4-epimerase/fuculose-1-phosphate aldolase
MGRATSTFERSAERKTSLPHLGSILTLTAAIRIAEEEDMSDRASMEQAKYEAAVGNRVLAELGLASGIRASLGHTSVRVPGDPEKFVVKGRGYRVDVLSRMRPEDMVVCDLEGRWLDGPPYSTQCSEVKIHSSIYKARPDVVSVTHVHPDYTILMTVFGKEIKPMAQEGAVLATKPMPLLPQTKTITTDAEGKEVAGLLGDGEVVLLLGHGAVTVSDRSAQGSVMAMAHLEHQARLNYLAMCAAGRDHPSIPLELALAVGTGGTPPHIAERQAQFGGERGGGGLWAYFEEVVASSM